MGTEDTLSECSWFLSDPTVVVKLNTAAWIQI